MRLPFAAALIAACLPLAACGGKDEGSTKVQMKDMEVVDGTATDAMTDLDGVQSEGTAVALPGNESGNNSTPRPAEDKPAATDAEVVADQ